MPERNLPLINATWQHIQDHPETHDQGLWVNACGTAACFCGHALLLSGHTHREIRNMVHTYSLAPGIGDSMTTEVRLRGAEVLGLDLIESGVLFHADNSRRMLELMVKDLNNGEPLRSRGRYCEEALFGD